jgi:hypothetical protein
MWDPWLIILSILFCAGARALNTFPFSACANIKRKKKIPMKMQIVIWFAGLRGAIAFALAMTLTTPNAGYIITTTLCIVIFTTVVCGGTTEPRKIFEEIVGHHFVITYQSLTYLLFLSFLSFLLSSLFIIIHHYLSLFIIHFLSFKKNGNAKNEITSACWNWTRLIGAKYVKSIRSHVCW